MCKLIIKKLFGKVRINLGIISYEITFDNGEVKKVAYFLKENLKGLSKTIALESSRKINVE